MRLKREDRLFFTEQMSLLLLAGVPIISALELLLESNHKKALKRILEKLKSEVSSGASISSVLEFFPKSFSSLYIALIAIGEASGKLADVFVYLEKIEKQRLQAIASIKKALIYPVMVLLVAIAVLVFILMAVVPTFEVLYQSSGVELPDITQKVIVASHFLLSSKGRNIFLLLMGILWVIRAFFRRKKWFRRFVDRIVLKLPIIGSIFLENFNASFSEILSVMIRSGVPLVKGIELYSKGVGNTFICDQLLALNEGLKRGGSFHQGAKKSGIFSNVSLTLISVGEVGGTLALVLERSAEYHADMVTKKVGAFIALIDPLSMVFIGLVVGVILVALYLPMFSMGSAI
ncbi:type II secretion system F family protein [Ignatzschineria sp. LJL83]